MFQQAYFRSEACLIVVPIFLWCGKGNYSRCGWVEQGVASDMLLRETVCNWCHHTHYLDEFYSLQLKLVLSLQAFFYAAVHLFAFVFIALFMKKMVRLPVTEQINIASN